jgi:hypothetical protein
MHGASRKGHCYQTKVAEHWLIDELIHPSKQLSIRLSYKGTVYTISCVALHTTCISLFVISCNVVLFFHCTDIVALFDSSS